MASAPSLSTAQPPTAVSLRDRCTLPPLPSLGIRPSSSSSLSSKLPTLRSVPIVSRCAVRAALSSVDRSATPVESGDEKLLLEVKDLTAVIAETGQEILKGVNLAIYEGEVHAVMGKNGSGKSTFAKVPKHKCIICWMGGTFMEQHHMIDLQHASIRLRNYLIYLRA